MDEQDGNGVRISHGKKNSSRWMTIEKPHSTMREI